jgi:hypothetical protein
MLRETEIEDGKASYPTPAEKSRRAIYHKTGRKARKEHLS